MQIFERLLKREFDVSQVTEVPIDDLLAATPIMDAMEKWFGSTSKSFAEVVSWQQYDHQYGFYQTHLPMSSFKVANGADGKELVENPDQVFVTFASLSPLLAHLLSFEIVDVWRQSQRHIDTEVIGDGSGILTTQVLRGLKQGRSDIQMTTHMVERTPSLYELQQHTLAHLMEDERLPVIHTNKDARHGEAKDLDVVYSLELLDALPPEVFVESGGQTWQMVVELDRDNQRFLCSWRPIPDELKWYADRYKNTITSQPTVHIPSTVGLVDDYAKRLRSGGEMIMIDYYALKGAPPLSQLRNRGSQKEVSQVRNVGILGDSVEVYGLAGLSFPGAVDVTANVLPGPLIDVLEQYGKVEFISIQDFAKRIMREHGETSKHQLQEITRQFGTEGFQVLILTKS